MGHEEPVRHRFTSRTGRTKQEDVDEKNKIHEVDPRPMVKAVFPLPIETVGTS